MKARALTRAGCTCFPRWAHENKNDEAIKLLEAAGADPDAKDADGKTPL